jgi:uncharacterized membrane protein SirB2
MLILKIHLLTVVLSLAGFIFRGILMLNGSAMLKKKWLKIAPHVNDTILLVSAILLVRQTGLYPLEQPWLMAKIIGLLVYIGLGMMAFRFGKTRNQKLLAWMGAIAVFAYICGLAITKSLSLGM